MSFDLFVGLPGSRILRSRELLNYFNSEQEPAGSILPEIGLFASELAKEWPSLNPAGTLAEAACEPDNERATDYGFGPTSLYLCFNWSRQAEALEKVRALAVQHKLLFFNCSSSYWVNAARRSRSGRAGEIFLCEKEGPEAGGREWSGRTTWIEPGDADLLTAPGSFTAGSHFGFGFAPQRYMQTCNTGNSYIVEYRDGSQDEHYQAATDSLDQVRKSFNLYYEGSPEAFRLLDYRKMQF